MAIIVLIIEVLLVVTFIILSTKTSDSNEENEVTCPYCGKKHIKPIGKMKDSNGYIVFRYEHCGHEWNSYWS